MSQARQSESHSVRSLAVTYRDGERIDRHSHSLAQLIYAASGTMRVSTDEAAWLVPPTRAIWVPPRVPHEIHMRGQTAMRTLYVSPQAAAALPHECRALEVSPLLRELVLHIVGGMLRTDVAEDARLCGVFLDLLAKSETTPLGLPLPKDPRARRLAEALFADPASPASLADLARNAAASVRTLQRLFAAETGLSIEAWRTRARLQQGLVQLTAGASVTAAALDAGYASPSAFIAAFKAAFGVTPARYRAGGDR
ncbi:helix-turn-helix domain-containing protein [Phenylobacterium terrae]|uniref:Helix-turn-helix domain-containing protein n=1 Tax=Phenylobacterium terrae TaxID=2665495 RepID=A0ABW4N5E1_9CAUL